MLMWDVNAVMKLQLCDEFHNITTCGWSVSAFFTLTVHCCLCAS